MQTCKLCNYVRTIKDTAPAYECPQCGAVYAKVEAKIKADAEKSQKRLEAEDQERQKQLRLQHEKRLQQQELEKQKRAKAKIVVKTYVGKQADAIKQFQIDSALMASQYYFPTSQSFVPGSYGCFAYLISILLIVAVGLGLIILGYMLIVKPEGTLTVTYEYRPDTV